MPLSAELHPLTRIFVILESMVVVVVPIRSNSEMVKAMLSARGWGFRPVMVIFSQVSKAEINLIYSCLQLSTKSLEERNKIYADILVRLEGI